MLEAYLRTQHIEKFLISHGYVLDKMMTNIGNLRIGIQNGYFRNIKHHHDRFPLALAFMSSVALPGTNKWDFFASKSLIQ